MAQAFIELQRLLASGGVVRGRVVRVSEKTVEVATSGGIKTLLRGGDLSVGQYVRIENGTAYASAVPSATYAI